MGVNGKDEGQGPSKNNDRPLNPGDPHVMDTPSAPPSATRPSARQQDDDEKLINKQELVQELYDYFPAYLALQFPELTQQKLATQANDSGRGQKKRQEKILVLKRACLGATLLANPDVGILKKKLTDFRGLITLVLQNFTDADDELKRLLATELRNEA
ncbi:MAG: hypothetical protein ACK4PR_08605, partial [Gammaproteobacteria bacterium]